MKLALSIASVLLILTATASGQSGEFRGMWVSRFEWPDRDPAKCRAKIDEIMRTLAENNFNAVIFQVRGQCDTMYPSPEEPWSPFISADGSDPGWDPMAYAVEAAHAHKLEFHAYINTHVAWQSARHEHPAVASHVFFKHFNGDDPNACDWLVHDGESRPVTWGADNYVWIAPGVPAAQAYTRRQVMHIVNHYEVDGVHVDRIRTPAAEHSRDPISLSRAEPGAEGNPAGLDFAAWTDEQFTRFLCDLYAQIVQVKPHMKVSSAPLGLVSRDRYPEYPASFHYGVTKCHQDAQAWLAAGAMDFVVPQIYWADNDNKQPDFSRILPDWVAHAAGRHIYAGHSVTVGIRELARQVGATRDMGASGNVVFSYGGFKRNKGFELYRRGVYRTPVATPALPWKDSPSDGIVLGLVTDARTGEPIVDAQVRRDGSEFVALSSADGLYSFLKVPPGTYRLTVRKHGMPDQTLENVTVVVGQVTQADVRLGVEPAAVVVSTGVVGSSGVAGGSGAAGPTSEPAETPPDIVAAKSGREQATPDARSSSEPAAPAVHVVRQGDTVVVQERPAFVRWMLGGLIVAGLAVGGFALAAALSARRNKA